MVWDKKIFEVYTFKINFSSCDLLMQQTGMINATLKEVRPRNDHSYEVWTQSIQ